MKLAQTKDEVGPPLSRRHPCRFSNGYISLSTKHKLLVFVHSWKNIRNYRYAKFQADPVKFPSKIVEVCIDPFCMRYWLMMSAAADVISVPSVMEGNSMILQEFAQFIHCCVLLWLDINQLYTCSSALVCIQLPLKQWWCAYNWHSASATALFNMGMSEWVIKFNSLLEGQQTTICKCTVIILLTFHM